MIVLSYPIYSKSVLRNIYSNWQFIAKDCKYSIDNIEATRFYNCISFSITTGFISENIIFFNISMTHNLQCLLLLRFITSRQILHVLYRRFWIVLETETKEAVGRSCLKHFWNKNKGEGALGIPNIFIIFFSFHELSSMIFFV